MNRRYRKRGEQWLKEQKLKKLLKQRQRLSGWGDRVLVPPRERLDNGDTFHPEAQSPA